MTTILADYRLGVMVSDSGISDDDRVWLGKKVHRVKGVLLGFAGDYEEGLNFLTWWKAGKADKFPKFGDSTALILDSGGLTLYEHSENGRRVTSGIEAIGTGGKAAICAYEALGFTDPVQAVKIVCKHDAGSRSPVRTYKL